MIRGRQLTDEERDAVNGAGMIAAAALPMALMMGLPLIVAGSIGGIIGHAATS